MQIQRSNKSSKHPLIIQLLSLSLALLMCLTPLEVHADLGSTEVEAEHSDGTYKSSGGKWYATYPENGGYKGQGVLLYLLERNGGGPVAGTSPKAYPCTATMATYKLHAQDKYNRYPEVTSWESAALPWGGRDNGGFMHGSLTSNASDIKKWLKTPSSDGTSTKGIGMVRTIWGPAIEERFTKEEIILIAEPIVGIQFAQCFTSPLLDIDSSMSLDKIRSSLYVFRQAAPTLGNTVLSPDLMELVNETIRSIDTLNHGGGIGAGGIPTEVINIGIRANIAKLEQLKIGTNIYYPLGDPYAGTPKKLIDYYNSLQPTEKIGDKLMTKSAPGRKYYRTSANAATYVDSNSIVCKNANFNLWPANQGVRVTHSDNAIKGYSIGMLAMCAWTDDGGNLDIYKVYQNQTGGHKYTIHLKGSNPYAAENEDNFSLIQWKTSTVAPTTEPDSSTPWGTLTSDKPTVQSGTSPSTITTGATEKAIYISSNNCKF